MSLKHNERCPVCRRKMVRSHPQNNLLWLLYHKMAEQLRPGGQQFSAESYHLYYKSKYLGCIDTPLPNGQTLSIPRSTADLDVAEFSEFYGKVEAEAAERGVYLDGLAA